MLASVAKLLLTFPTANMTEAMAAARKEGYHVALCDLPTWAIDAAGKRWMRGEVTVLGDKPNLSFPPSPPQLRLLALDEIASVRGASIRAKKLLNAKVRKEVTPEERERVLRRIRKEFPSVSAPKSSASTDGMQDMPASERGAKLAEMARALADDIAGSA